MPDSTPDHHPDPTDNKMVRSLLAQAGLAPSDEEIAVLVAQYPAHRIGMELIHAVPELRYESPALTFSATPALAEWNDQ